MTDIADQEPLPSEDTTPEEKHDPHQSDDVHDSETEQILDYINSQHHQEEDMHNALQAYTVMTSLTPDTTPQHSINSAHIHLIYHVAQAKQAQQGSLVDRGANGGLAGSDVRVLSTYPGNALLLVLTSTRSMVWTLCNVLHWSKPTMGMSTTS